MADIIDLCQYKVTHLNTCSEAIYADIRNRMLKGRPKDISIFFSVRALEFQPLESENTGKPYTIVEWEIEGSLKNIAAYILSNAYPKLFLDIETGAPLFCTRGQEVDLSVSTEFRKKLQDAIEECMEYDNWNQLEFLYLPL